MICKNCGSELRDDAKFCGVCGLSVEEESEGAFETQISPISNSSDEPKTPQFEDSDQPAPQKISFGIGIVAFCAVLVFIMSVVCGVFAGLYFSEKKNNSASLPAAVISEDVQW